MEIILKDLSNRDYIHKFKDILTEFYKEIEHHIQPDKDLEILISDFSNKGFIKIAVSDDEIVGFISIIESSAIYAGGKFGVINELYVKPHFRSKGIGEKLLLYADQLKKMKGWSRLELSTPEESKWKRTLNFYLKEGFTPTGVRMKK